MIENLIKTTTLIGTFIIFNGVLYLSIYYSNFGINIFSYLEFTEIITSFLDSIKIILIFFGIYLLNIIFPMVLASSTLNKIEEQQIPDAQKDHRTNIFIRSLKKGMWISVIIAIVIGGLLLFDFFTINKWLIYFLCFVSFNLVQTLAEKLENSFILFFGEKHFESFYIALIFVLPFTVYTIVFAEYNSLIKYKSAQKITLVDNDNCLLNLNNEDVFIGKSSKYIFLYNFKEKYSQSISLDNIKTIKYQ